MIKVYYTDITDDELLLFHKLVKVNASYDEIKDNDVFMNDEPHKLIPLFNYDNISDDDNVNVLDEQCIVYMNDDDIKVYFESSEEIQFDIIPQYKDGFLRLHFYDKESLFNLNNFAFNISNTTIDFNADYTTDKYGNVIIPLDDATGTFTVISNNQNITFEV